MNSPELGEKARKIPGDVYRDLRDRRLLPIAALLVIAIIALPMLLKAGAAEPPPMTELAVGLRPLIEAEPVVVAETPVLRNFSKRLNQVSSKNPFRQPTAPRVAGATDPSTASSDAPLGGISATGVGGGSAAAASTDPVSAVSGGAVTGGTDTGGTDTGGTDTGGSDVGGSTPTTEPPAAGGGGDAPVGPVTKVISYRIDAKVGPVGDAVVLRDVKPLALLPGDDLPIAQYLTSDFSQSKVSFVVSTGVTDISGDGRCAPTRTTCRFLRLKIGDEEQMVYEAGDTRYMIKLLAITPHWQVLDEAPEGFDAPAAASSDSAVGPIDALIDSLNIVVR